MLKAAAAKAYQAVFACVVGAACVLASADVDARYTPPSSEISTIALARLPLDGRLTYAKILQGGPFSSDKDGSVFGNRERILPRSPRGYYREYTVRTPGVRHRGARRIVCGGEQPRMPEACYYTRDHYTSFQRIIE